MNKEEEMTIERGCFNCARFKKCLHIDLFKRRGQDFMEIFTDQDKDYRFGCSCSGYQSKSDKEQVQFT